MTPPPVPAQPDPSQSTTLAHAVPVSPHVLLTAAQIAEAIGMSDRWFAESTCPHVALPSSSAQRETYRRYSLAEVAAWLEGHRVAP
jgi:hypothetical protein